jgi:hypothetical protein
MVFFRHTDDEEEELETPEDEDAALADDVLDEVESGTDAVDAAEEIEGFGLIADPVDDEEEDEEKEEEGDEALEEDAEDVDFDTFDDIDEM